MTFSIRAALFLGACVAAAPGLRAETPDPLKDEAVRKLRDSFRIETLALFDAPAPGVRGTICAPIAESRMTWCAVGIRFETTGDGTFTKTFGYHLDPGGRVVHAVLARREYPLERARFDATLRSMGARYGGAPFTLAFKGRTAEGDDVVSLIAVWGALKLVRLDDTQLRKVASGDALGGAPLVDHRQDVRLSAQRREAVYRIEGTAGFIAQLRSVSDVRTDIVQRLIYPAAFDSRPSAAPPVTHPLPLDPPLVFHVANLRAARERREAAERRAAEEQARLEAAQAAEAERAAAEGRARRAETERRAAEERARRRTPPASLDRAAARERAAPPERKVAPADENRSDVAPAASRDAWLRMAATRARNSAATWVFNRARDRISDDLLLQASAVFTGGERLAMEISFECNIDAGKRLKAHVRAFDARTKASLRIAPEDGQSGALRGIAILDDGPPQTAFLFPERDERQASIVEVPVTRDDVKRNAPRAQTWLRHYQVAIKLRLPQGEALAIVYPYDPNLRRVLEGCVP